MGCNISDLRLKAQSDKIPNMKKQTRPLKCATKVKPCDMIMTEKIKNKFGTEFLPADKIEDFTTSEFITSLLRSNRNSRSHTRKLEEHIRTRPAKRCFLLLVSINRVPWLKTLADPKHNFGDADLPTSDIADGYLKVNRNDKDVEISFSDSVNDPNDIRLFCHERWSFLAPVFTTTNFYQEFDDRVPLPFLDVPDTTTKNGSFGTVHKVELHRAHQLDIIKSDGKKILVALKTINNLPQDNWFVREMKILERIQAIVRENPSLHIVTPIASYKLKKDSGGCLLFPWAEGGNLKEFWDKEDNKVGALRQKSRKDGLDKMVWILNQMRGLCEALVELHRPHTLDGVSNFDKDNPHFRHGDLKPENILAFREGGTDILRIADLGLGRFHLKSTDDRRKAKEYTKTVTGTTRYMPPEFSEENHISRKLDVWSLGCLFIEFIIWAAWGVDGLNKFNTLDNDEFWQKRRNSSNVVHDNISWWIESMSEVLKKGTALGDILKIVSSDMLKRLDKRRTSQEIYKKLELVIQNSQQDREYYLNWDHKADILGHALPDSGSRSQNRGQKEVTEMKDKWTPHTDNDFARKLSKLLSSHNHGWMSRVSAPFESPSLCGSCSNLELWKPGLTFKVTVDSLVTASGCRLCALIYESLGQPNPLTNVDEISIHRNGPTLEVEGANRPILSLYTEPGSKSFDDEFSQIGTPGLPAPGCQEQFLLFKEWIRVCVNDHGHAINSGAVPMSSKDNLPTRVVDVGSVFAPSLRLVKSEDMESTIYLALSHRWGDDPKQHTGRTLKQNHVVRYNEIPSDELPLNFNDAIAVARGIGIQYLWIDSLCIIQDSDDDWKRESVRMEQVYSNARCVLAACSANSSMEGFLKRLTAPPSFVPFRSESGDISYISKNIDNFKGDVDEATLNTRGWTLQERALARRTIHFSKNQVYFECSKGVQCESLIRYTNESASLLADSDFPSAVETRYKGGRVMLIQSLYNQYSKREFWDGQDRPIGISGLEKRLTSAFNTRGGYGVFQSFLERNLLWKKGDETQTLKRIEFPRERNVPTWSWMAYDGVISYVDVDFGKVEWTNEYSSPFDSGSGAQGKWHWEGDGTNRPPVLGLKKVRQLKEDELPQTISLDVSDNRDSNSFRCVVLGKDRSDDNVGPHETRAQYYVLIVKPSLDTRGVFKRAGAGTLQDNQIVWDRYEAGNLL